MKDYRKLLGPESYKEGEFFYELIENERFDKKAYDELLDLVKEFRKGSYLSYCIDKEIAGHWFHFIGVYRAKIHDMELYGIKIEGVKDANELFDYYEELYYNIMAVFTRHLKLSPDDEI